MAGMALHARKAASNIDGEMYRPGAEIHSHSRERSRDDDDLANALFLAHTPECFPRITEWVSPINNRRDFTRFKQLSHMNQVFAPSISQKECNPAVTELGDNGPE